MKRRHSRTFAPLFRRGQGERVLPGHAGGETVLVVQDAGSLRGLTKRILIAQGYAVVAAANAADAIQLFDETPSIGVLLTDGPRVEPQDSQRPRQLAHRSTSATLPTLTPRDSQVAQRDSGRR